MQASWGLLETYFVKFSKTSVIDNVTFRLHYKLTCYFLLMCSALSTCYQHFGKPINCIKREKPQVGKSLKISSKHLNLVGQKNYFPFRLFGQLLLGFGNLFSRKLGQWNSTWNWSVYNWSSYPWLVPMGLARTGSSSLPLQTSSLFMEKLGRYDFEWFIEKWLHFILNFCC